MEQAVVRHIGNLEEFEALRGDWNRLWKQCGEKTVFLTWEWLYAWWKHNAENKELWALTVWREDKLVGAAPLMLVKARKHGMRFRLLQSLGTPNADHSDFMAAEGETESTAALCRYILSQKSKWDAVELNEHRDENPRTREILRRLSEGGLVLNVHSNLHHHIPIAGAWETYFKGLSRNTRRDIEKRMRHLTEKRKVELKRFRGAEVRWEHFETLFEVNKNGAYPQKYESRNERAFHRELLDLMSGKNWIEIVFLYLDDKPAAYEYGFNLDGKFEDWRTGYDKNYAEDSAGKALLILLLQEFFKDGYNDFDFLRGEYEHKDRWKPSSRKFLNVAAVKPLHLPARLALIVFPNIWRWLKAHILHRQGSHHAS
ncbi:MAG: GNAT family N-acetyltransferase [Chloroflexi bacterium]|nr:GNAT family N-acetyltransferase [Chloroflexota bacterium]